MGIQSKRIYSTDESYTLNEQLPAPCVNYRCYYSYLWQCCARLRHFESKEMPRQRTVNTTMNGAPLELAASPSAWTSASLKIAIKESTTPGTRWVIHLYTKLQERTMLMWPNSFLKTLPMWTVLTIGVQQ